MRSRSAWVFLGAALVAALVTLVSLRAVLADDEPLTAARSPQPDATSSGTTAPRPTRAATERAVTITASPRPTPAPRSASPVPSPTASPTGSPTASPTGYTFPVSGCDGSYAATHHDYPAADIFTGTDCTFVSPVDGRVDEVGYVDHWDPAVNDGATRGGLFVSVVGSDGVRYYGAHLAAVAQGIRPGVAVRPGQPLGRIGETGSARGTGTHLHFGLSWPTPPGYWWIRRGVVAPQPFLDAWRRGADASPVGAVAAARQQYGDDARCHVYC